MQAPLIFDIYDGWNGRSLGGCVYRQVSLDPEIRAYVAESFPPKRLILDGLIEVMNLDVSVQVVPAG